MSNLKDNIIKDNSYKNNNELNKYRASNAISFEISKQRTNYRNNNESNRSSPESEEISIEKSRSKINKNDFTLSKVTIFI